MRTRSMAASVQAWSVLDLYEALVGSGAPGADGSNSTGWPGVLHISDSPDAISQFAQTGSIPRPWAQGTKLIPASELTDEALSAPKSGAASSQNTPSYVLHQPTKFRYYLRLPDADLRVELPNLVKLRTWGRELPTWKLAGFVNGNETDDILAILLEPKENATPLAGFKLASISQKAKEKWAVQVEATMRVFLDIGVVWNEISLEDIDIDEDDDVLFTRFTNMKIQGEDVDMVADKEVMMEAVGKFRLALGLDPETNAALWVEAGEGDDTGYGTDDVDPEEADVDSFTDDEVEDDLPKVTRVCYRY